MILWGYEDYYGKFHDIEAESAEEAESSANDWFKRRCLDAYWRNVPGHLHSETVTLIAFDYSGDGDPVKVEEKEVKVYCEEPYE